MVHSSHHTPTLPPAWRFALIGAVASLPVAVVVNLLPNSEATIGGAFIIFGALIAGGIAATRSADPEAAGFRAGFLGGVVGVLGLIATVFRPALGGGAVAWPSLFELGFIIFASGLTLGLTPVIGLACGRIGGWAASKVAVS